MEPSDRHHASKSADHAADGAPGTGSHADGRECALVAPNNVVHQRRRVNPESLALRLGPDLVRDLDALIIPGNTEMPSFAVRKELQERYSIDRRHIYDYFHSRGLRVVKEDKHGNLLPAKDLPTPLPNLRPLRQAPVKNSRSHPSYPVAAEKKLFKSRGVTKARPGRPKNVPSGVNPKIVPVTREINQSADTDTTAPVDPSPGAIPTTIYVTVNPLLPHTPILPSGLVEDNDNHAFTSAANLPDESFSVGHAIGCAGYTCRHLLVFEKSQEPADDPDRALTVGRSVSWKETVTQASPCSASDKELLLPHTKPLTRDERHAIYEALSDSLGPAHGIQECQGTYRKHMEARTKLYFEGLLPVPYHHSQQPPRTSIPSDRNPSLGTNEFRHWLSETKFLKRDGVNGSPRLYPTHRNPNGTKQQDVAGVVDKQFKHGTIPFWAQTLDELFPTLVENLNSGDPLTDSPVIHTREVTRMTTHAQGFADKCNAGDRSLFLVASHPSSLIIPAPSVPEIRQSGDSEIHGVPDFPGERDVKTRMLVAEMDSRPQPSEHVSCVARSGSHFTLNDTQLRGRKTSNSTRICPPSCSPRKPQIRDLDRIRTRPHTSRDARRRTPSAAGDI